MKTVKTHITARFCLAAGQNPNLANDLWKTVFLFAIYVGKLPAVTALTEF